MGLDERLPARGGGGRGRDRAIDDGIGNPYESGRRTVAIGSRQFDNQVRDSAGDGDRQFRTGRRLEVIEKPFGREPARRVAPERWDRERTRERSGGGGDRAIRVSAQIERVGRPIRQSETDGEFKVPRARREACVAALRARLERDRPSGSGLNSPKIPSRASPRIRVRATGTTIATHAMRGRRGRAGERTEERSSVPPQLRPRGVHSPPREENGTGDGLNRAIWSSRVAQGAPARPCERTLRSLRRNVGRDGFEPSISAL